MAATDIGLRNLNSRAGNILRSTPKERHVDRAFRRLLALYLATMFVTSFFVDQGSHDVKAVGSGAINLGSVVFAISYCLVLGYACLKFSSYRVSSAALQELSREPAFVAFASLLLLEIFSSFYASAPIGAIYQSAPGLLTLIILVCFYSRLTSNLQAPRAYLSALWNYAMVLQTAALALLLLSAVSGSNGFTHESGILPIRLRGTWLIIHPDLSGLLAEVGLAHFLLRPIKPRPFRWILISINLLVFLLAQSRTSYSVGAATLLVWYIIKGRRSVAFNTMLVCLAPVGGFLVTVLVGLFRRGQNDTDLAGLTGRTKLWTAAFNFGTHRPILGYGAFSGVRLDFATVFAQMFPRFEIRTLDNQFVNTFIECGAIGVLALVGCIAFMIIGTLRAARSNTSVLSIELLGFSLALPLRAWLGQLFVLYDPTQLYGLFIVLWIALSNNASANAPSLYQQSPRRASELG